MRNGHERGVLLVGDYPPPYGGVSVQVSVLHRLLDSRPGYRCAVLDIGDSREVERPQCLPARSPLEFVRTLIRFGRRGHLIHVHTNGHNVKSWIVAFCGAAAGLLNGRRTVLTFGSGLLPDFIESANPVTRSLARSAVRLAGAVICRNDRTRAALLALGAPQEKVEVLSGFYGACAEADAAVPAGVEAFLARHSPVLGAIAGKAPEYGIPLLLEAATELRRSHSNLGVVLVGAGRAGDCALGDALYEAGELPHAQVMGVLRRLGIFIRPTYFDGDASSVREALGFGVPVVASDTDFRPPGVVRFRRGDVRDLIAKIDSVLRDDAVRSTQDQSGSLPALLVVYERVARGWAGAQEAR